jgi:ferric-dicitrate binding protein FerR (iron transport regulator)
MRQLYTSPRQENIDRVVDLLTEKGIETTITNRSNWNKPSYQRFSYSQRNEQRESWPQVWVNKADDYTQARALLKELGIEPVVRHAEELALARNPSSPERRRQSVANRIRRIVMLAVAGAFVILMLRYMGVI